MLSCNSSRITDTVVPARLCCGRWELKTLFTRAAKIAHVVVLFAACGYAGIVSIDVEEKAEVAGGKPFGAGGAYRRITGTARFAIDPAHPRNRNNTVLFEVVNRGQEGVARYVRPRLASIRDLIAYLKRDHQYAIGFGASQSAMVLRGLLYEGFNEDEEGNLVFDGIFAHIAGARRSTFQRFVQASRTAFSGGQHGPASFPPRRTNGQNLPNFNDYRWSLRALLADLRNWIVKNEEPPPSEYPSLARATLTSLENYSFPAVPGVGRPRLIHTPHSFDFRAGYRSRGVIANEPPPVGGSYAVLVPQSDKSGNDMGGVRMPEISCALGSFTGWNLRDASAGNSEYLLSQAGSYIPLPWTGEDRRPGGDPRPAVKQRFANKAEYRACVEQKVSELIDRRLLLPSDSEPIMQAAMRHWDWRETTRKTAASPEATGRKD